jgi:glycosyltransferase involved in cell wall biosynthesis
MLQMRMWRRWRNRFKLVVANCDVVRDELIAAGVEPVEVVLNGTPERPPRPRLSGPPIAAYAGRLVKEKGVDILLRAWAQTGGVGRLLVAGDGPERKSLEQLATNLGVADQIVFLGHRAPADLERLFEGAWVHVAPSVWAEPFGFSVIEAMMLGVAIIASDTGGLTQIVESGRTGLLVPPGDPVALSSAIRRVLGNRELAADLGAAGRQRALAHFTDRIWADRFLALYNRILN